MAANKPMIASTQTISSRTTPSSAVTKSARPALNVRRRAGAALLAVRAVRDDVIGAVLAWRSVDVSVPPGIIGNEARAQIRPVPGIDAAGALRQGGETFARGRIAAGIEIEQVERAREALHLDAGGLDL